MTDEQINAAIARALNADEHWMIQKNYCADLNAMHEAEKVLSSTQQDEYWDCLIDEGVDYLFATARQRAEAFLKTLGKWEEVQG
jgi:hypothetical protein